MRPEAPVPHVSERTLVVRLWLTRRPSATCLRPPPYRFYAPERRTAGTRERHGVDGGRMPSFGEPET